VPDYTHAIINELFRNRCELAAELLPGIVVAGLDGLTAESAPGEVAQVKTAEHRADSVTLYRDAAQRVRVAIVVEVQHTRDGKKRWTWPHYVAGVRVRYRCPTYLLVVALDAPVARWARSVISLGHPGFELSPLVISANEVPIVESAASVKRSPELAVLSALAHRSVSAAQTALLEIEKLAGEQAVTYSDAILRAVPELQPETQEKTMIKNYKFQSAFFRKIIADAKREARRAGIQQERKAQQKAQREAQRLALLEAARGKLGKLSAEEERALRAITDVEHQLFLLMQMARAEGPQEARAALARSLPALQSPRGGRRAAPRGSRRAA
jgi:hypothetical protein